MNIEFLSTCVHFLRLQKGYTALLLAAEKRWESCINMLLSGGANKNTVNHHGDTALAIATKANDKKCVQKLLSVNVRIISENKVPMAVVLCVFLTSLYISYISAHSLLKHG